MNSPTLPSTNELDWKDSSPGGLPWIIADLGNITSTIVTLRDFTRALEACEIADTGIGGLPGSFCLTPIGVQIFKFFENAIHSVYRRFGFGEWAYPSLADTSELHGYITSFGLEKKLVYASGGASGGGRSWVLCPTGEAILYPHWKRKIRHPSDLPIRSYRVASYFRPPRGKHTEGIFRQIESTGIYECYGVFAEREQAAEELNRIREMLAETLQAVHLRSLCSVRPLTTNNERVSEKTIGFDVPLSIRKTTQVASAYLQNDRLSKVFGITYRRGGVAHFTAHCTGYVSRRSALVHLLLGLRHDGTFVIHPELQPVQILLLFKEGGRLGEEFTVLCQSLVARGLRVATSCIADNKDLRAIRKSHRSQGTSVDVIILPRRTEDDTYKIIVTRYDQGKETALFLQKLVSLDQILADLIGDCERYYSEVTQRFFESRFTSCQTLEEVRGILKAGKIAVSPMQSDGILVRELENTISGEVLGFKDSTPAACIVSRRPVETVAYFSRRM